MLLNMFHYWIHLNIFSLWFLSLSFYILHWFCHFNNRIIFSYLSFVSLQKDGYRSGRNMKEDIVYKNYFTTVCFVDIIATNKV